MTSSCMALVTLCGSVEELNKLSFLTHSHVFFSAFKKGLIQWFNVFIPIHTMGNLWLFDKYAPTYGLRSDVSTTVDRYITAGDLITWLNVSTFSHQNTHTHAYKNCYKNEATRLLTVTDRWGDISLPSVTLRFKTAHLQKYIMISVYSVVFSLVLFSELSSHSVSSAIPAGKLDDDRTETDSMASVLDVEEGIQDPLRVYTRTLFLDNKLEDGNPKIILVSVSATVYP